MIRILDSSIIFLRDLSMKELLRLDLISLTAVLTSLLRHLHKKNTSNILMVFHLYHIQKPLVSMKTQKSPPISPLLEFFLSMSFLYNQDNHLVRVNPEKMSLEKLPRVSKTKLQPFMTLMRSWRNIQPSITSQ